MMNSFEELNKSICRLCLRFENSKKMVSLIDNTQEDGLSCYAKGVSNLTKVIINKLDPLPKFMCLNCLHLLKQAIYFKLQCEHTDKCYKNIARGYCENKDVKQAIAEFAMLNFYLDYKYSFSSTINEKDKCNGDKSNIQNYSDNSIEDNLQCDNDSPKYNINALHTNSDVAQDDHPTKDSEKVHSKILIENDANFIIIKPLQISRSPKVKHNAQENNLLNILEQIYVPKEYDVPIKKVMQTHKKLKSTATTNTEADEYIKKMEEMFGTSSCGVAPADDLISPRRARMKFKRRAGHSNLHSQNELKQNLICNVCGKVLANQHTYKHHMQRHNGCRYICEHCGKGFPVLKELQIHQVCRHGTGPYLQCSQCPFKAPRKLDLMEHERIHSGERPYTCEKCGLTFRRRGIWRKHLIYHTEKKVQCPQCNKKFFQRSDMLAHANNVHERVYVYLCSKCGATYAKGTTVRRHMMERHGIPREAQGRVIRINKMTGHQERRKE